MELLNSKTTNEFLKEPMTKLIIKYATPAVIAMLFMAMYQIVDGMMVGQKVGMESLAAINVLYPVLALLSGLGVMIGVGGNTKIAIYLGENKVKEASKTLGLIVLLGVCVGVLGTVTVYLLLPNILDLLGADTLLGYHAGQYLLGITPFFTLMLLLFILEQSIRNDGKPGLSGVAMIVSALSNVLLTYIFLYVFELETMGAGLATGISQSIGACIMIGYFVRKIYLKKSGLNLMRPNIDLKLIRSICFNGSSEGLNSLSLGVTTFLFNMMIIQYVGTIGVAAYSIVSYLLMIGQVIIIGIAVGVQPIMSYNYGANQKQRVISTLKQSVIISTVLMLMFFMVLNFWIKDLTMLFTNQDSDAIQIALDASVMLKWSILIMPINVLVTTYFTALEKAKKSFIISLLRGLLLPVVLLIFLSNLFGAFGIWFTPFVVECLTLIFCLIFLKREKNEHAQLKMTLNFAHES
jgi:putative MATE family efflux protein